MIRRVEELVAHPVLVEIDLVFLHFVLELVATNIDVVDSSCQRCRAQSGAIHGACSYRLFTDKSRVSVKWVRIICEYGISG